MRNSVKILEMGNKSPSDTIFSVRPGNLLAYYKLDEVGGSSSFADTLGLAPNLTSFGTVTAGAAGVGDGGTSVEMGPGSSRINSADPHFKNSIDGDAGAMACFFKADWGSASQPITAFNGDNSSYVTIELDVSSVLNFTRRVSGTYYSCSVDLSLEEPAGFMSIAATWDQGAGETKLYVDGVQRANRDGAMDSWDASVEATFSCRVGWAFGDPHAVAHAALWDVPINPTEILSIHESL